MGRWHGPSGRRPIKLRRPIKKKSKSSPLSPDFSAQAAKLIARRLAASVKEANRGFRPPDEEEEEEGSDEWGGIESIVSFIRFNFKISNFIF